MEQHPLRLGDLVDDYCPRERRITNHAIVAIVNDAIRQTRCMTCDAEHSFKGGKVPPRRTKASAPKIKPVDEPANGQLVVPSDPVAAQEAGAESEEIAAVSAAPETAEPRTGEEQGAVDVDVEKDRSTDAWPANRTLIRATLPRTEGDPPPPRPIPEFTMHRYNGRGGNSFRQGRGWDRGFGGNGNGSRDDRRQGQPFGGGHGHGRRRHGKKRPR